MLVLSRRENQKILFPNLGITVEIIGLKGRNVRIGVDAPPEIRVLRAELAEPNDGGPNGDSESDSSSANPQQNTDLNPFTLQIQAVQKLLAGGDYDRATEILEQSLQKLRELDHDRAADNGRATRSSSCNALQERAARPRWKALLVEDDANSGRR